MILRNVFETKLYIPKQVKQFYIVIIIPTMTDCSVNFISTSLNTSLLDPLSKSFIYEAKETPTPTPTPTSIRLFVDT